MEDPLRQKGPLENAFLVAFPPVDELQAVGFLGLLGPVHDQLGGVEFELELRRRRDCWGGGLRKSRLG